MSLSCIFYLPSVYVTGGVEPIINNRFVKASSWDVFLTGIVPHLYEIKENIIADFPEPFLFLLLIFFSVGLINPIFKKRWTLSLLMPSVLVGGVAIIFLKHRIPFVRTWIYLIPITFIIVDAGLTDVITNFSQQLKRGVHLIIIAAGLGFSVFLVSTNGLAKYEDYGYFPEAKEIVLRLNTILGPEDRTVVKLPADWPVYFYNWYYYSKGIMAKVGTSESKCIYFIENMRRPQFSNEYRAVATQIIMLGEAVVYRIDASCIKIE